MSSRFERPGLVRTLLGVAIVQALAIGALLLTPPQDSSAAHTKPPQAQMQMQAQAQAQALSAPKVIEPSELDSWRDEAVLGGSWAGVQLVTALLDNYERSNDSDNLFEALQWMERSWVAGHFQDAGIATRVFERHCDHKVVRWHWLCDQGE